MQIGNKRGTNIIQISVNTPHPYKFPSFPILSVGMDPPKKSNPNNLSPAKYLTNNQSYFFTHGFKDKRILFHHFEYFQSYVSEKNINADFWMIPDAYHVDAMFKYPDEYGYKMKKFFEENLK